MKLMTMTTLTIHCQQCSVRLRLEAGLAGCIRGKNLVPITCHTPYLLKGKLFDTLVKPMLCFLALPCAVDYTGHVTCSPSICLSTQQQAGQFTHDA